ncbi:MAG: hypothetical protein ACRD98_01885 [Nitrososphaera sp.]
MQILKDILICREKHFCSTLIPSWESEGETLPIVAGKIGGMYSGEELHTFELEILPLLEARLCHPVRVAVIAESGEKIFTCNPSILEAV